MEHDETVRLIGLAQAGDKHAEETLIVNNIALVKSIVRGYLGRGTDYDDLVQIGSIGLLKAVKGYDSAYNVRFSTYAVPMISGEIKRFLRDDGIIKVSRSLKENSIKIYRAQETLKNELGRDPDISELAERTGLEMETIVESLEAVRDPISIFEPVFQDKDSKAALLLDTMPDLSVKEDGRIVDALMLEQLLGSLTERERKVVLLRFYRDKTQSEIARIIGVSQVQVSRIISHTIEKMQKSAEE